MKSDYMIFDYTDADELAQKYGYSIVDVLLIAINRYGVRADREDKRIRFKLKLDLYYEKYYMAVCVNTCDSPFVLVDNMLLLNEKVIGEIFEIEKDTCDTTYFRRNKTELTLNSNKRSHCYGCTFCGTYNLQAEDQVDLSSEDKIDNYIKEYLVKNSVKDLSDLVRVTLCTGCFGNEKNLVAHIISVYKVLREYGFNKRIRYIGSQIRSDEAMQTIAKNIPYFSLSLTVECFSNRKERMRKEKGALELSDIHVLLRRSLLYGFSTNYLYICGLDELNTLKDGVIMLSDCINRLPIFQVMQNYEERHEELRVEEAKGVEYYLEARKIVEEVFLNTNLKPRSWENYRSLFYNTYQNNPYNCMRI